MKPPRWSDYLIGNGLLLILIFLGCIWTGYRAYDGQADWLPFLGLVVFGVFSSAAQQRVATYRAWKREWDVMEGRTPFRISSTQIRYFFGVAIWIVLLLFALSEGETPGYALPIMAFYAGSIVLAVSFLLKRRKQSRGSRRRPQDPQTKVLVRRPSRSPDVSEAYASLPAYCGMLLDGFSKR